MNVYIETEVFNDVSSFEDLTELTSLFRKERHQFILANRLNKSISRWEDDIMNTDWIKKEAIGYTEHLFIKKYDGMIRRAAYYSKKQLLKNNLTVSLNPDNKISFSLEDALIILNDPLSIFVEDKINDKSFLMNMIRITNNEKLKKAIDNEWIKFEHGGGSRLRSTISDYLERRNSLFSKFPRMFVLLDSDKYHEYDKFGDTANNVLEVCHKEDNNISDKNYHVLHKREIENYLPVEMLEMLSDGISDGTYQTLQSLSSYQLDYYDMENGFEIKKDPNKGKLILGDVNGKGDRHNGLFNEFRKSENFKYLRKGLGEEIDNVKEKFNSLFNNSSLTIEMINKRCEHHPEHLKKEIELILDKIEHLQ